MTGTRTREVRLGGAADADKLGGDLQDALLYSYTHGCNPHARLVGSVK